MENLTDIAVFVRIVDSGSFTRAAQQIGLSRAVASKYVARLEQRLGARLLNRTTRRLSLTEAGAALYARSREALREIEEAELEITRLQEEPRGTLRVNAPMSFGILHLAPALPEFLARHPGLMVDLRLDDRIVDLVEEGFDLAIRIADLQDSTLVARRLAPCRQVMCASPDYLKRRGVPRTPEELTDHNCIVYTYGRSPNIWRLRGPDGSEAAVPVAGNLRVNNGMVECEAALRGLGVIITPTFYIGDLIGAGRLQAGAHGLRGTCPFGVCGLPRAQVPAAQGARIRGLLRRSLRAGALLGSLHAVRRCALPQSISCHRKAPLPPQLVARDAGGVQQALPVEADEGASHRERGIVLHRYEPGDASLARGGDDRYRPDPKAPLREYKV